jgi:hypothetical protein
MSLDLYPALDAGEIDVAVALERVASAGRVAPLGAASLFFENSEEHWPDDLGNDLSSRFPPLEFENLASDGATIGEVFGEQLTQVEPSDEPVLLTLTIGQTDVLSAASIRSRSRLIDKIGADIVEAYDFLTETLRGQFPNGLIVLTTVCDPSDGTAKVPGVFDAAGPLPLELLDRLNAHIRALAAGTPNFVLADAQAHFRGHGITAPEADRWYWKRSLVELNARGASELRHLWLDALDSAEQT